MIDPDRLRPHPLLQDCRAPALALLAQGAVERRFARGATLFRAGDKSRGLLLLLEGRVRVVRLTGDRSRVVHFEDPGGTLGEVPLYDAGGYPATAIAERNSVVAIISRETLTGALRLDEQLAWALLTRMAARVRTLVERLEQLSVDTVQRRLAEWLLRHADDRGIIVLGQSQAELAAELGTAREVLVRELGRLRRGDVLRTSGRRQWRITDRAALQRMTLSR
jgi:CRP-like cAMP-binding protein